MAAFISFSSSGIGTYAAVIYAFVVLPILDMSYWEKMKPILDDVRAQQQGHQYDSLIGCCTSTYQLYLV